MGLLTILKKMKQKEKEVRLLMLYPVNSPVVVAGAIYARRCLAPPNKFSSTATKTWS